MIVTSAVALVFLAAAVQPVAITDWGAYLKVARSADRSVSYRGLKEACLACGAASETAKYKVVHLKPDLTRTEYYSPKSVAGTLIVRRGASITKYSPGIGVWDRMSVPSSRDSEIQPLPLPDSVYSMEGITAVAGRPVYVVAAKSNSNTGLIQRFWVDKACNLILATELRTAKGELLGYSRFVSIKIEPKDISGTAFREPTSELASDAKAHHSFRVATPRYLPKGYSLSGVGSMIVNAQPVVHVQFSNGEMVLSLFQRRTDKDLALSETRSGGTTVLTWAKKGTLFTLLGKAPSSQLRKIALSIYP